MGIKKGEEVQAKEICNILNKTIEKFPNIKKVLPVQVQEASCTPNRFDQNRTSPWDIIIKTTSTKSLLKAVKEKNKYTHI
jgi:hypothetical protein